VGKYKYSYYLWKTLKPLIFRMYKMIVKNGKDLMKAGNQ
jgi:hypothetical protein